MNITERSSKDDIITAALELTDDQAKRIETLTGQANALMILLGLTALWALLF